MKRDEWHNPKRVILVAHPRSGSTMLATALDSHPDIGFERGEPFSPTHIWRQMSAEYHHGTFWRETAAVLLNRPGYRIVGFRVTYKTIPDGFWKMVQGNNVKIIHLTRENVLRTLISAEINTAVDIGQIDHYNHTFYMPAEAPPPLIVDPHKMLEQARKLTQWDAEITRQSEKWSGEWYALTFEDMVGLGRGGIAQIPVELNRELCEFLEVRNERLVTTTRRVNPFLIQSLIKNFGELLYVFENSEFAEFVEAERAIP